MNTIFAQSSARGKAGVTVFRISGSEALNAIAKIADIAQIKPRICYVRTLKYKENVIDQAMLVYFPKPKSFTGEDVVEIHTHGSIAVMALLTEALLSDPSLRLAEPGEFTKRAFLNHKMDLTMAEGLSDLIEAETSMQHKQAMRQMSGELGELYISWRKELLGIMSFLEAYIDFPDEDIPDSVLIDIASKIENLKSLLQYHIDDNRRGERLRQGIKLTILGAPNVGKSSLLNFLTQREVAIVSHIPGTTRDVIESHIDIGGYPIILTDTAGIRKNTEDLIEKEGIARALKNADDADIKIVMFDINNFESGYNELSHLIDDTTIILVNKIDMQSLYLTEISQNVIHTSIKSNINTQQIINAIEKKAENIASPGETPAITRLRHRQNIMDAISALIRCDLKSDIVLAAEDIRMAARSLERMTGKLEVDEILGEIFSNFCIGK